MNQGHQARQTRLQRFRDALEGARERRGLALMGICNVTPDSFSDGGRHFRLEDAQARVRALMDEGADVIDIGGESTRPGAVAVPAAEQIARVLEVVRYAADAGACVSIDTASPAVAAACLDAGACLVNDVSCLRDVELASVCAAHGAALLVMHSREPMSKLRGFSAYPDDAYENVIVDVTMELMAAVARAVEEGGLTEDAIVVDPGLGFAKNARQSLEVLQKIDHIRQMFFDYPLCIGASRKSFLDRGAKPTDRLGASIAAALYSYRNGADMVRIHDVHATRQALETERALVRIGED